MPVDALAPFCTRSSRAMILIMYDKHVLVFHEVGFQLPEPSQCWEMSKNTKLFIFHIIGPAWKELTKFLMTHSVCMLLGQKELVGIMNWHAMGIGLKLYKADHLIIDSELVL